MTRCRCLLALGRVLALAPGLAGQELLTLDRQPSAALAQNASLRASGASAEEAAARVTEAHLGLFPRLPVTDQKVLSRMTAPITYFVTHHRPVPQVDTVATA